MTILTPDQPESVAHDVIDTRLSIYDVVLTEHLVGDASPATVFRAAKKLVFLTVRAARDCPHDSSHAALQAHAALRRSTRGTEARRRSECAAGLALVG